MATLTNVRIYTHSKAVPKDCDITIAAVMVVNNAIITVDSDDVRYVLGTISAENIVIETPSNSAECGCSTSNTNVLATLIKGVDGITPDMSDYYDKEEVDTKLERKQNVIGDLDSIRSGSAKGATALQSVPSEYVTETELQAKGYATLRQVNAKQDKINDLDAIREGASKGSTALQTESYRGTVTGVKVNDNTYSPNNGIVDLGAVVTEHQPLKTINGETIVGEGNIEIEGGSADLEGYATEEYVNKAVEAVNVKGEDGYVYSNGEKVDMRFTRSLIPVGTSIPAKANLNSVTYLRIGKYYCSMNADAKTITNCPTSSAFAMEVFNPLSTVVDNETTSTYVYRLRIITEYNTGIQYIQTASVSATINSWTYSSWYLFPRTIFSLNSSKNDGTAALGSKTQGVYVDSSGTLQKMTYALNKTVPSNAVFTDASVTAVGNHYIPAEDENAELNAPIGSVVTGIKRDAAGHVVGIVTAENSGGGDGDSVDLSNYYTKDEVDKKGYLTEVPEEFVTEEELPESLPNPQPLRISVDGATPISYDGSKSEEVAINLPKDSDVEDWGFTKVYITDFDVMSLNALANNPASVGGIAADLQGLEGALAANMRVLVPYSKDDDSYVGYANLVGWAEDLLYFKVITEASEIIAECVRGGDTIYGQDIKLCEWQGKQDRLVSGTNIRTINGESILGAGDLSLSAQLPLNIIEENQNETWVIPSGKATVFTAELTAGGSFNISTSENKDGVDNAWVLRFAVGTSNTGTYQVTSNTNIKWANGGSPVFENGKYYELSFRLIGTTLLGVWASFE